MEPIALAYLASGIGLLGAAIGAGVGIGRLAASALDGTARQPEATNELRTTMIIAAALIEGIAIIAIVVSILLIVLPA